jgi:hypothetical protein
MKTSGASPAPGTFTLRSQAFGETVTFFGQPGLLPACPVNFGGLLPSLIGSSSVLYVPLIDFVE